MMPHHATETHTLKVPGARIHYEVRGSGPVLLMIPGGPQDAGVFAGLARRLADHYTTVAYDPRGNSRSTLDGEPEDQRVDVHGDDAARLIEALGGGPAYVFGNSAGAQIGLDLAARYPALVRVLVAHEPPCLPVLDDPTEAIAADRAVHDTYLREGVEAGIHAFMEINGLEDPGDSPGEDDAPPFGSEDPETFERISGNFPYFLAHGLLPLSLYRPDVETLREGGTRVVVGLGVETTGQLIHDVGLALAGRLETEPVLFPGDHIGFGASPDGFADTLHRTLKTG